MPLVVRVPPDAIVRLPFTTILPELPAGEVLPTRLMRAPCPMKRWPAIVIT